MALSAALFLSGAVQADSQYTAVDFLAVQIRDGRSALMPFHLDGGEALALAGEDVLDELDRTHWAISGEEGRNALFGGRLG